jgi:ribosomal protein L32
MGRSGHADSALVENDPKRTCAGRSAREKRSKKTALKMSAASLARACGNVSVAHYHDAECDLMFSNVARDITWL